ncbi:hypothetical protein [Piscinibacter terrae]|uniref:Uncharacterized protein n=1 Tax=Piscinibacter terrae TaxID=2496871 RepID=A0A3N7IQU7_9BURK|nr:hypothetical protein [Albitalea terrae]RQP21262.1 hypothetical protein DZC73_28925 [Albitalea terrae]
MSDSINPLSVMATAPTSSDKKAGSWYQAMADAWGQTLDRQASSMETIADKISAGDDKPATITQLSAESLKMGFLSNTSHTALSSTGEALKTMAQKS